MARATDRLKSKKPPAIATKAEAAAELFLAGIEQAFNDPNEKRLVATVRRLGEAPRSLESAIDLYESRPDDSGFRWGVVYLASKIGSPGTAEWLTRVALEELPDPKHSEHGCEGPRDGEVLVRIMAAEGIGLLADSEGSEVISDALTTIITGQADPAVRSAAVVQLLRLDPAAAPRIRKILPKQHKQFADVKLKTKPSEVDQRLGAPALDPGESPPPPQAGMTGA